MHAGKAALSPGFIWCLCTSLRPIFPYNSISSYCSGWESWCCMHILGRAGCQPLQRGVSDVGVVQNPGWMLGASGERPETPWGATGQTRWLKTDTEGVPIVCMQVYMYFPLTDWLSPGQLGGGTGYESFLVFIFTGCYPNIELYFISTLGNETNQTRAQCPLHHSNTRTH